MSSWYSYTAISAALFAILGLGSVKAWFKWGRIKWESRRVRKEFEADAHNKALAASAEVAKLGPVVKKLVNTVDGIAYTLSKNNAGSTAKDQWDRVERMVNSLAETVDRVDQSVAKLGEDVTRGAIEIAAVKGYLSGADGIQIYSNI